MSRKAINRSSLLVPRVPTVGNKQHTGKNKEAPKDLVASEALIQKEKGYDRGINGYQIEKDRNLIRGYLLQSAVPELIGQQRRENVKTEHPDDMN